MLHEMIFAGFGGQGVLSMGQLLTYAGMMEEKNVSWLPSYGPEMRGGTANCNVIVSDEEIGSPVVTSASAVVVMNRPSLDKFEEFVAPGGKLFINSSLIDKKAERTDIEVYYVPATGIATDMGNVRVANIVMLGAVLKETGVCEPDNVIESLAKVLGPGKEHLIPLNREAIQKGADSV
jgi:2-oxoglutarate ferredoxin oxidoreductase subunit gamma